MRRRPAPLLATATAVALLLPACATVDDAVDQAGEAVSEGLRRLEWCTAAFRLAQAVEARDIEAGRAAAEDMQASAPDGLQDDLQVVLDAIDAAEQGDMSQIEGDEVRAATEEIRTAATEQCDPTTRPG